ncbi:beta-1,4-glucuronyltransferase 1-like [Tachypleus tridentatus]|uniref:beta-1,4-glucuronyltransferase 1-like n=1 Tax=Tachypleus tridentatus TaxID=6853 RepID=UPI003FD6B502
MSVFPCRSDSKLFIRFFVVFNVLLALFNILSFRITPYNQKPCIVVTGDGENYTAITSHSREVSWVRYPQPQAERKTRISGTDKSQNIKMTFENWTAEVHGDFILVKNYISAVSLPGFNESVTLTTQGTYPYLHHAEVLCGRWDGPLSVAVYAPGTDLPVVLKIIFFLQQCGNSCVSRNVSWHLVYDMKFGPDVEELKNPENITGVFSINCTAGMEALNLSSNFRKVHKLPYPINLLRNLARLQAKTYYVLPSDIELYPSVNIVSRFLQLVAREKSGVTPAPPAPHVYHLPIFEVKTNVPAPTTKEELVSLLKENKAIFFHKWVCDQCQRFPRRDEWVKVLPGNNTLGVFQVTKRKPPLTAWEPIYIGTNNEPLYDERLTWEGKRDKMSQMYELCLLNYDVYILDNAFLVHAPGIKRIDNNDQKRRMPYIAQNNRVHSRILKYLKTKYGDRKGC